MTFDHLANREHSVYRLYAADGELLYVGCTVNLAGRVRAHRTDASFGGLIARVEVDQVPSRSEGLAEEARQIRALRPHFNVNGRGPRAEWSACDYYESLEVMTARPATDFNKRSKQRLVEQFRRRYPLVAELTGYSTSAAHDRVAS